MLNALFPGLSKSRRKISHIDPTDHHNSIDRFVCVCVFHQLRFVAWTENDVISHVDPTRDICDRPDFRFAPNDRQLARAYRNSAMCVPVTAILYILLPPRLPSGNPPSPP